MQSSANAIDAKRLAAVSAAVQAFIAGETPAAAPSSPDRADERLSEWRRADERLSEWRRAGAPDGGALASRPRNWTARD